MMNNPKKRLASMYQKGLGVTKDFEKSIKMRELLCERGNIVSYNDIACILWNVGRKLEAIKYWLKGMEYCNRYCLYELEIIV